MAPETFTAGERALIRRLDSPVKVQCWLETLPYNHERHGETLRTFRVVRRLHTAHCLEAALAAACILEQHGHPPVLLDLESVDNLDHVLFLYKEGGRYGTVARSRDPGLHGRRPVFRSLRDLVRSYVAPYIDRTGRICGFGTYDLRDLRGSSWRTSERNVWTVERTLIAMPHSRFHYPDAEHARWHERYLRYLARHPGRKPVYYPNRDTWL